MANLADVVFALTGDARRNSRALRQLRALAALGLHVDVLTFGPPAGAEDAPWRYQVLPRPEGAGPRFFWAVHRLFREAARARPARVYHASDLFTLSALHAAARRHTARLAYDARELYPHVGATAGRPHVRLFWTLVEGLFIRRADAVFTVNESIARELAALYRIARPTVLPNVPPRRTVAPTGALRAATGIAEATPIVLYQGYLKVGRGCEALVDALPDVPGAALVFLGEGPLQPRLEALASARGVASRMHVLPMVPPDALLDVTASADVGACLIEPITRSLYLALPNKLFEYLMAGLPVIGSNGPEIRQVIERHDVGLVVDPSDRAAVVAALRRLTADAAARRAWAANAPRVFETFSASRASHDLQHTYRRLLDGPSLP